MFKPDTLLRSDYADRLTRQINRHAGEFDILALLRLLKWKGYQENNIRFTSHLSQTSQNRLIEQVQLYHKHAIITVNMGLLGIQTPFPAALLQEMEARHLGSNDEFDRLLKLLDHSLILNFISSIYPEFHSGFFQQWRNTLRNLVLVQDVHSSAFLYWLFQLVFPEFTITFGEEQALRQVATTAITLNQFSFGDGATLGGVGVTTDRCIHITLYLEKSHYRVNTAWINEVEQCLQNLIYPLLDKREVYLLISLQMEYTSPLKLSPAARLGRDLLAADNANPQPTLQHIILHQGSIDLPDHYSEPPIQWGEPCRIQV